MARVCLLVGFSEERVKRSGVVEVDRDLGRGVWKSGVGEGEGVTNED